MLRVYVGLYTAYVARQPREKRLRWSSARLGPLADRHNTGYLPQRSGAQSTLCGGQKNKTRGGARNARLHRSSARRFFGARRAAALAGTLCLGARPSWLSQRSLRERLPLHSLSLFYTLIPRKCRPALGGVVPASRRPQRSEAGLRSSARGVGRASAGSSWSASPPGGARPPGRSASSRPR